MKSRTFGLLGGLGPPSTVHYYEALLKSHAALNLPAKMLIAHADLAHTLTLIEDREALADYLVTLVKSMAAGGAEFYAMAAVTPHMAYKELLSKSPIPFIDIIDVLTSSLKDRGHHRVGFLGNKYTMSSRLFGRLHEFDVIDLGAPVVDEVHRIYISIIEAGRASERDAKYLRDLSSRLVDEQGADVIIVGGTELSLVLEEGAESFPVVDAAKAHIEAITTRATLQND